MALGRFAWVVREVQADGAGMWVELVGSREEDHIREWAVLEELAVLVGVAGK